GADVEPGGRDADAQVVGDRDGAREVRVRHDRIEVRAAAAAHHVQRACLGRIGAGRHGALVEVLVPGEHEVGAPALEDRLEVGAQPGDGELRATAVRRLVQEDDTP